MEDQHDAGEAVEMLNTLRRGGIEVQRATADFQAGGRTFPAGSYILPAAQAFRAHLLDMMEPQEHPHREIYPGGPPEPPYGGLAGYTLPIQMGVESARIDRPFQAATERVDEVPVPSARLTGSGEVLLVTPAENRGFTALHRALREGATVSRAAEAFTADGNRFAAGTYVVEGIGGSDASATVNAVARELSHSIAPHSGRRSRCGRSALRASPSTSPTPATWTRGGPGGSSTTTAFPSAPSPTSRSGAVTSPASM
jgi:hypothetical protein